MKPCSTNRKLIAWLALDALDAPRARHLRAHLENCEGCRRYLEEISNVKETLTAAEIRPHIQASESFHQRVVRSLKAEETGSTWETLTAHFRGKQLSWRVALPVIAASAMLIAALSYFGRRPDAAPPLRAGVPAVSAADLKTDLLPTIANYQMVANQSLDKLDELLTRQGNRNPSPTRIYTASNALD